MATQVKRMKMEHEGASVQSLSWDYPVHLVGEKVNDPDLVNCCSQCFLPILIYGRMIPCKHVLCLDCAKKFSTASCYKCGEKVTRIEQNPLGTVFVCSYGGPRHGAGGCKRSYLSFRDMEAHIKHRHKKKEPATNNPVQTIGQPQLVNLAQLPPSNLTQPPPNLIQPSPHAFIRPPSHMPPHSHMVNVTHPPPGIIQNSNLPPPPRMSVSLQQPHVMTMQGNMATMSGGQRIRPGPMPIMQTTVPTGPPRHPLPGSNISVHHQMMGSNRPPGHQMPPRPQQLQGAPPSRPHRHVRPQQSINPPTASSKSHGNLISIPIQGSDNWAESGQQWSNQNQSGQHHRPGQYNS